MLPAQITSSHFNDYPPEARRVATVHIPLLQQLPLGFAPFLLQQIQEYDWRFPAERREIDLQLSYLESLSNDRRSKLLGGFQRLNISSKLEHINWVSWPGRFSDQLSTYLWSTGQMDAFRAASSRYLENFRAATPREQSRLRRLAIAVIGKGLEHNNYRLFGKLRPYGTYFTQVNPVNGLRILLDGTITRATANAIPFGHWYVDGGIEEPVSSPALITLSYGGLEPVREALLRKIDNAIRNGVRGPEELVAMLHQMRPEEIGLPRTPQSEILNRFKARLLTEGSGVQIFSTTFVQWATRELWRRAQPMTILARFAPRQRERPMHELLAGNTEHPQLDPAGSLIDADMAAYYMWIDQQRLSGTSQATLLVWFENHGEALVISPNLPRNTESNNAVDMQWLFAQVS